MRDDPGYRRRHRPGPTALGPDPFYAVNAKIVWRGGQDEALRRLAAIWDE